jgi:photosystem II stability/assembly factor-like uncharacterized protein
MSLGREMRSKVSTLGAALLIVALGTVSLATGATGAARPRATVDGFDPASFSFVSPGRGWVLGSVPCTAARGCLGLRETTDGGQAWSNLPIPSELQAQVRKGDGPGAYGGIINSMNVHFANVSDGWIYNSALPIIWSTHDGGRVWHEISSLHLGTYGSIFDVDSSGGVAYMIAAKGDGRVALFRSSTSRDSWSVVSTPALELPAGGGEPGGNIVLKGTSGWLMVGNDRGVSASLQLNPSGTWTAWNGPCEPVGNSYFVPAVMTAQKLAVVCTMGGFASPLSKSAPPGATIMSNWLYFSSNEGRSFHYGPELSANWIPELLAAPSPQVLLLVQANIKVSGSYRITRSTDDGRHWTTVYHGGWALALSFQNSQVGMGLVQDSPSSNSLLRTVDGGVHWSRVSFSA